MSKKCPVFQPYVNAEKCWLGTLVTLLPPLLSSLLCMPGPLLRSAHPLAALPPAPLCQADYREEVTTYLTSVAILGFLLPLAITLTVSLALIIRRCVTCGRRGGRCCSSYTKEELALVLVSSIYTITHLAIYLPILDIYLER